MTNRFHKLKNNDSDFPILDNVDVYRYDNDFDYSRYIPDQMKVTMCKVPWDMGEAHIGNRTISGIGNVVYFGSAEKRDAWFDAIPDTECYRFSTKYKELHRDNYIDVPVPFDVCAKFNYIAVEYAMFANDDSPVMYENPDGVRKWFWFIREVEFIAANNTRLHVLDDAFQTWIYDVDISGMVLERGHAPMYAMKADRFLQNPLENNAYLLTEDVSFGEASVVKHVDALAFNAGTMYACIATTANPRGNWGTKAADTWHVPASSAYQVNGQPSVFVFAMPASDIGTFLSNVNAMVPQFRQTVQGVFFASQALITLGETFQFAGTTCHLVHSSRRTFDFCELDKTLFGYGADYADIAKLYTSPYAHIEVTDENGNVDIVKIEDTTGDIDVSAAMSLAYPFVTIDAHLLGVGGTASASVTYRNITEHTFDINGQWYDTIRSWEVPVFAIVLSPELEYDYSTHFDRAQRVVDYTAAYDNASSSASTAKANADASASTAKANADTSASTTKTNADATALSAKDNANDSATTTQTNADNKASTAKANADASADTAAANTYTISGANKTNADANADTILDNADAQQAANMAIQAESEMRAVADTDYTNALSQALQAWEAGYARDTANNQIDAAYASAAIGAAGGAIGSAVSGGMSGASAGPAGAAIGAVGGLIGGAISGATSMAQTAVAANLTSEQAEATVALSQQKVDETSQNNSDRTDNQNYGNYYNTVTTNNSIDTTATNSATTMKNNATRTRTAERAAADATKTTEKANNLRSYNTETANNQRSYDTDTDNAQRTYDTDIASNRRTYDTATANNQRTYGTATGNNQRTYDTALANAGRDRSRAISDIENDIAQAALRAPSVFGEFANGGSAANKPIALFANIVTQSKSAISSAGDEFLRYGYMYNKQWRFDGDWNVGKYFTYWKLRDFWVSNLNVPDMYMDKLRFFLYGGVTVWRDPADIGNRTIYENFNG